MVLFILRGAFLVLVSSVISLFVGKEFQQKVGFGFGPIAAIIGITLAIAIAVIAIDVGKREKKLSSISGIFLGLLAGMLAAYALSFVVDLIGAYITPDDPQRAAAMANLLNGIKVIIGLVTCYIAISLVIQTKDDFRFVIPYVEFAKEIRGNRPILLDTSVIIDGRILDIVETRLMQGTLVVPKCVLNELQQIADSADKTKRARGRRGLDILQKLQSADAIGIHIEEREVEGAGVDQKLIELGQQMKARIMTNDFNLNKVATLRGVDVINLNDVAKALRPVVLPGENLHIKLVKPGESNQQAVGYLDDGTMVVVENGHDHLNQMADVTVTSTLQTSAGRMIFANITTQNPDAHPPSSTTAIAPETAMQNPRPPRAPNRRNPRRS